MLAHYRRTHSDARAQPGIHLLNITPYCVDPRVRHAEVNRDRDKIPSFVTFRSCAYPIFVSEKQTRRFLQDDFSKNLFRDVVRSSNYCCRVTAQNKALKKNCIFYYAIVTVEVNTQRAFSRYVINPYVVISRTLIAIHRNAKLRRTGTIQDNRLVALESLVHLRIRTGQKFFFQLLLVCSPFSHIGLSHLFSLTVITTRIPTIAIFSFSHSSRLI